MQQKLHILFLPYWFPSKKYPKNGNFILRHAKAVATIHKVTVLFVERDESLKTKFQIIKEIKNNLFIIQLYYKGTPFKLTNYWNKLKAYRMGIELVGNFDLIHVNVLHYYAFIAYYFKIRRKINFVVTEHWTRWITKETSISLTIYYKLMRVLCYKAAYLLPVSGNLAENMMNKGVCGNLEVIPNVVDSKIFMNIHKRNERNVFLHISNLNNEHKNITGILNVTKKLAASGLEFCLEIGGDGDDAIIKEFIKNNHLENYISTFGSLSEKEVSNKMRNADVFIMFSNKENQPCVINEAFSCGLPVISTKVGGISEYFPNNFGILVKKANEEELYSAMEKCIKKQILFADPITMHTYAETHFGIDKLAEKFDKIYRKSI